LVGGDEEQGKGGLMADLGVFDNPQSVKRISEYLSLVNSLTATEGKGATDQGPLAAVKWYTELPETIIGLQQGALADASRGLSPQEQRFVADYYRVLGTIGGMRTATKASSAQWSYNTLRAELPTPGAVTNAAEARRRINNFIKETNVVAKRNPLVSKVNPNPAAKVSAPPGAATHTVSLAAAKQLPQNKGKTDDEIKKDIEAHGYKVGD
jgi:hypothetical protein